MVTGQKRTENRTRSGSPRLNCRAWTRPSRLLLSAVRRRTYSTARRAAQFAGAARRLNPASATSYSGRARGDRPRCEFRRDGLACAAARSSGAIPSSEGGRASWQEGGQKPRIAHDGGGRSFMRSLGGCDEGRRCDGEEGDHCLAEQRSAQAAKVMLEHGVSGLPVVDDDGEVVGIITEGDLLRRSELGLAAVVEARPPISV